MISKEREIFKNVYNERPDKLEELIQKINFDNLKCFTESSNMEIDFNGKEDPITFLNNIKKNNNNRKTIKEAKDSQEDFNKYLKMIRRGNKTDQQKQCCQIIICFLMEEMILSNL